MALEAKVRLALTGATVASLLALALATGACERIEAWKQPIAPTIASKNAEDARRGSLARVVNERNYVRLGFQTVLEAKDESKTYLGTPFPAQTIHIERLRKFERGEDPHRVLVTLPVIYYPVLARIDKGDKQGTPEKGSPEGASNQLNFNMNSAQVAFALERQRWRLEDVAVRTSITMYKGSDASWKAVSYGATTWIKALFARREELVRTHKVNASDIFLVRAEPFKLDFLAFTSNKRLFLAPVQSSSRFGFMADEVLPANDALEVMVPAAVEFDEDLPG